MSEYQYYHFQALDRPLNKQRMQELRDISTRADITPTSFINVYNWGDLKADPHDLMRQYFEAHVYVANWGFHRFMLKIPRDLIDVKAAQVYCGECCNIYLDKQSALVEFETSDESGEGSDEWDGGEGWMEALLPLREEIMRGDLRSFYIAWLAGAFDDDLDEPPLPPGVSHLSGAQQNLGRFLNLDECLLQAAIEGETSTAPSGPTQEEMAAWVTALPTEEKDSLLLSLLTDDTAPRSVSGRLCQQFHQAWRQAHPDQVRTGNGSGRTVGELWQRREALAEIAQRQQAEAAAKKRAEQERQAAQQRQQYLALLAGRESRVWQEVAACLSTTQPKKYDEAVTLLRDLCDLANARGDLTDWQTRITEFRQQYARKSSLMQRFTRAGFP